MRFLLIEDNARLAGFISLALEHAGFTVDQCQGAEEGCAALATNNYDLLLLDLSLPDGDGMDVLRTLRRDNAGMPVIVLTARDGVEDRVKGLNAGADDYVLKPFEMVELIARINALMRRPGNALGITLKAGNVVFDTVGREVSVGDKSINLSRRELAVLEILMRRSGRVVPKDVIGDSMYGFNESMTANSIEVAMHRLRKRLDEEGGDITIHTLRGVGYQLSGSEGAT